MSLDAEIIVVNPVAFNSFTAKIGCVHEEDGGRTLLLKANSTVIVDDEKTGYEVREVIDYDVYMTGGCQACRQFTVQRWRDRQSQAFPFTTIKDGDEAVSVMHVGIEPPEEDDGS